MNLSKGMSVFMNTLLVVLGIAVCFSFASVGDDRTGWVEWEDSYVYATAVGSADMERMKTRVQAEQVAIRTARHLAYAELNETVNDISIDAKTTYRNQISLDDILKVETHGVLKRAHVVDKRFRWTDMGEPRAWVKVGIPIKGGLTYPVAKWIDRRSRNESPDMERFDIQDPEPVHEKSYTGLIIDTREIAFDPALYTRILSDNSKVVYDNQTPDFMTATSKGFVGWVTSLEAARLNWRAGTNPLEIQAKMAYGPRMADIVVTKEDAKKILTADMDGDFLKDCRVVLIVESNSKG